MQNKRQRSQGVASSDAMSQSGPAPRLEITDASSGEWFLADWADGEGLPPFEVEEVAESDPGSVAEIPPPQDQRQRGVSDSDIWAWLKRSESPDSLEMHLAQHGWTPPESESTHEGSDVGTGEADGVNNENRFHC